MKLEFSEEQGSNIGFNAIKLESGLHPTMDTVLLNYIVDRSRNRFFTPVIVWSCVG